MDIYKALKKYKLKIKGDKIFDPVRNKWVQLTPEEKVRQEMLQFMIQEMRIPMDRIGVELSLSSLGDTGNRKRIDIGVFNEENRLIAIVECKADYIGDKEAPYQQAIGYVSTLSVYRYFVVDGYDIVGYFYDPHNDQFVKLEEIPTYEELIKA